MFKNKYIKKLSILFLLCIMVMLFSSFPTLVENWYSMGMYIYISRFLRLLFGWLPFSIGDILYTIFGIWAIYSIVKFFIRIFSYKNKKNILLKGLYLLISTCMIIYLSFNLLWGLNYNRAGISKQLNLELKRSYTNQELNMLAKKLIYKTNFYRKELINEKIDSSFTSIKQEAIKAYNNTEKTLPFFKYKTQSIKVPVYNALGNYLNYSGYINPFTNEAQVNTLQPSFLLPFVVCHEMAHQVGYGTEDEANLAGYLTCVQSQKNFFKYSTYLQLFRYANNELFYRDSMLAKENYKQLDTLVKKDIEYMRNFFKQYQNPFEKYTTYLYNQYLKANEQPQGIETYTQVTAWLLAYENKYKKL